MSSILVTGASGFIGKALSASLAERHDIICLSRKAPGLDLPWVRGDFGSFEDLRQLEQFKLDAVIHLAAVTGGGTEREQVLVNVEGTRCLLRYLVDRGCNKCVLASSIAAVGFQNVAFRPLQLPIPDEHPCLDRNGYGLSKYLMEEITRYYSRQHPSLDLINLRLSTVCPDDGLPPLVRVQPLGEWSLGGLTIMALTDAVRAFTLAVEAPQRPGARVMNAASPEAWAADPVADILRGWYGDAVDVSHFEQPAHAYDSVYDVRCIATELGFVAQVLPQR